ncbi:MAG: ATP-binding protein, partial [Chromatiales bacterium]|nr:ATP-binding protein [Chromatiales bacterium]
VLIEDDGVGMDKPAFSGHPGEHLGLSIMQERARYLGGKLLIESEPGEGTRVQLKFSNDPDEPKEQQHFALI